MSGCNPNSASPRLPAHPSQHVRPHAAAAMRYYTHDKPLSIGARNSMINWPNYVNYRLRIALAQTIVNRPAHIVIIVIDVFITHCRRWLCHHWNIVFATPCNIIDDAPGLFDVIDCSSCSRWCETTPPERATQRYCIVLVRITAFQLLTPIPSHYPSRLTAAAAPAGPIAHSVAYTMSLSLLTIV